MKFTNDPKRIAANIRAERSRANLSQEEVAKQLGLTRRTYLTYEEDASLLRIKMLLKLSEMFGCDINAFYLL
jgi:transcriptional regulator with XRE-family HTH domain